MIWDGVNNGWLAFGGIGLGSLGLVTVSRSLSGVWSLHMGTLLAWSEDGQASAHLSNAATALNAIVLIRTSYDNDTRRA